MEQFEYDDSIWNEDEQEIRKLKWAVEQLPLPDRILILLYAEYGSSRKVGKLLKVSHNLILKEVKKIKGKIFAIINGNSSSTLNDVPDVDVEIQPDKGEGNIK